MYMDINNLVSQLTLEEKAGLCSGLDFWLTKAVERLNIPSVMLSDGPHGLRKQKSEGDHLGINESIEAVCFPAGCAVASSFDRDLIKSMGEALGDECQAEDVSVILGPAVNIKRSPLCGRNFEYFSEDPYLAAEMATNHIHGVQSKNVGTSLKHYLANNQEHRRMTASSEVDERTLREIYLAAFEGAVKNAKPWTVMCSYNKINGVYASENPYFLTEVLRNEWNFDGYVVSDWGAVNDRVEGLKAGLDLEMPGSRGINDSKIVKAVKEGTLDETILDTAVARILKKVFQYTDNKTTGTVFDKEKHHELAHKIESESLVLLKNDGVLPLNPVDSIAFIGSFADKPRYQGGGSSHINAFKTTSALEAVKAIAKVTYAPGYEVKKDTIDENLVLEAVKAAKASRIAVIFAGLPDAFESEGYDRTHMSLPDCQNYLIDRICEVQPNTVVVLHNGSPVEMPWINKVKGVIEAYLGGQAVGSAVVNALFGKINPSGKLAETFPLRLEDNPSYINFPGANDMVEYKEGVFVGYRYYDKKKMEVLFPFGFGLSYTTFSYSNLQLHTGKTINSDGDDNLITIRDTDTITVTVDITNTGAVSGKEIAQLYVSPQKDTVIRPVKELKGFAKIYLEPGETKTVSFTLNKRAFAYYNTVIKDWHVESGDYDILIGKSSRDIVCSKTLNIESTVRIPKKYTLNSTFGDLLADPRAKGVIEPLIAGYTLGLVGDSGNLDDVLGEGTEAMMAAMFQDMPLRAIVSFGNGAIKEEDILGILDMINSVN
ncbi:glycoside hydrolase family 3 C-terminal domain-containing protein [Anaerocolumna sp. AGMB13025]|nr:glycoside hydrolase family 3 C-terminal domain-containing protein [Anaerocolumna sp. AGMB13025]WFR60132.1 glycoside hydrolase family 3 C-terminal domain-containing protein [Anaerocolumna sp. AGMB13025]